MFAYFRAPLPWPELARRTVRETFEDGCPGLAAELAFYFLLAVFPALLFLVALLAYLPIDAALASTLRRLDTVLPEDVIRLLRRQIEQVMAGSHGGLVTASIAGAIWSSSSAMTAIITALNRAYDIEEGRPWWKTRLIAVTLTIALAIFVVLAFALVVGGESLVAWAAMRAGFGPSFRAAWPFLVWPAALVLTVLAVDLVYYFAPNAEARWVWLTPGSVLATGLWLAVSFGFKLYVRTFGNYSAVYGAIAGVIVLMLWFYVSGLALLIGAELNAEIDDAMPRRPQAPDGRKKIGPAQT